MFLYVCLKCKKSNYNELVRYVASMYLVTCSMPFPFLMNITKKRLDSCSSYYSPCHYSIEISLECLFLSALTVLLMVICQKIRFLEQNSDSSCCGPMIKVHAPSFVISFSNGCTGYLSCFKQALSTSKNQMPLKVTCSMT